MKLSVLIATIKGREESFGKLNDELLRQIKELNLERYVQILSFFDDRELTIGEKRQKLLEKATSEYICFIDDDDEISKDYLKLIFEKIMPDCCSLTGVITTDGLNTKIFNHTIENVTYYENEQGYQRPPNHLNIIRREIAINYNFKPINHGEDTDWSMQICKACVLKNEAKIPQIIYHYKYKIQK